MPQVLVSRTPSPKNKIELRPSMIALKCCHTSKHTCFFIYNMLKAVRFIDHLYCFVRETRVFGKGCWHFEGFMSRKNSIFYRRMWGLGSHGSLEIHSSYFKSYRDWYDSSYRGGCWNVLDLTGSYLHVFIGYTEVEWVFISLSIVTTRCHCLLLMNFYWLWRIFFCGCF